MEQKTGTSTAATAYGKRLEKPITYNYGWSAYTGIDEVKSANDMLTDDEIVKVRNDQRQTNSRQKALVAALDAAGIVKPSIENDPQLRLRKMHEVLMSSGNYSDADARALAATTLSLEWED